MMDRKNSSGFTLTELMIVVAIIAVLAAIAIPVVRSYIMRARASEVYTVLQSIREKEEAYFAEFKRYTNTGDLDWQPYPAGSASNAAICGNSHAWALPANSGWLQLGFDPGGPTYYTYRVTSTYAAGALTGASPEYTAEAQGDVDCDGDVVTFTVTNANKTVIPSANDVY